MNYDEWPTEDEWHISEEPKDANGHSSGSVFPLTERGFAELLETIQVEIVYDVRSRRSWYRDRALSPQWEDMTDRVEAGLRQQMSESAMCQDGRTTKQKLRPWRPADADWRQFLTAHQRNHEVDLFTEWLDTLPPWDEHARIDVALEHCFRLDPAMRPLTAWVSSYLFGGAVMRALRPGCKLDVMPILVGPQGCGKSTFLRELLPPNQFRDSWYTDRLNLGASDQKRAEALQGRVIVEVGEMAGLKRAELEDAKMFLTSTDDGAVRLAYRRNPEPSPRRCILVGTANPNEPIPADSTGHRRFAAVDVASTEGMDAWDHTERLVDWLARSREQLWAEALAKVRGGWDPRLPKEAAPLQAQANSPHVHVDEVMLDRVQASALLSSGGPLRMVDLAADVIGAQSSSWEQRRLADALRSLGWERRRRSAGVVWVRP